VTSNSNFFVRPSLSSQQSDGFACRRSTFVHTEYDHVDPANGGDVLLDAITVKLDRKLGVRIPGSKESTLAGVCGIVAAYALTSETTKRVLFPDGDPLRKVNPQ
jgi:hypothetical protein